MAQLQRIYPTPNTPQQVQAELDNIANFLFNLDSGLFVFDNLVLNSVTSANDITISGAGNGLVLTTPDGNHTYRIAIDNSGQITSQQLT